MDNAQLGFGVFSAPNHDGFVNGNGLKSTSILRVLVGPEWDQFNGLPTVKNVTMALAPKSGLSDPIDSVDNELPWIRFLSSVALTGYVQVAILVAASLWGAYEVMHARRNTKPANTSLHLGAPIRVPYELCSQVTRAAAAAFLFLANRNGETNLINAIAGAYILTAGILRLVNSRNWRRIALHQANFVSVALLCTIVLAHWFRCIQFSIDCQPRTFLGSGTLALGLSVLVAFMTPREWVPNPPVEFEMDGVRYSTAGNFDEPSPEETCSWFNYYCGYGYLTPIIMAGHRGTLSRPDLPHIPWYDEPLLLLQKVRRARAKGVSTIGTVLRYLYKDIILMCIWIVLGFSLNLAGAYGMYQLLEYLQSPYDASIRPWTWLLVMFLGPIMKSVCWQQYIFNSTRLIIRVKSGFTQELYHLAMNSMELEHDESSAAVGHENKEVKKNTISSTGRLANLMASDVDALYKARDLVIVTLGIPTEATLSLIGLYLLLGWPSLVCATILLLASPANMRIAQIMYKAQMKVRQAQDSRVSLLSEYFALVRAVKYFAWEDAVVEKVQEARRAEQKQLWWVSLLETAVSAVNDTLPYIALFVMFGLYMAFIDRNMTASVAFPATMLVKNLRSNLHMFSYLARSVTRAMVSLKRLDSYFTSSRPLVKHPEGPLLIRNATFRRTEKATFQLKDVDIDFVQGGLNVVTGPSGSGKTTLLLSILGETVVESGSVQKPADVGYASQSAWLQSGSIKDNIVFASEFEESRYESVLSACCLHPDISELPKGDETTVGENGTSLSGGQRARVALARALYSKAPLLLLDDIFSALDTKTASLLWQQCFCTDTLKNRTVVLVTQVPWIPAQGDLCIGLEDGEIKTQERNLGVVRHSVSLSATDGEQNGEVDASTTPSAAEASPSTNVKQDVIEEEMESHKGSGRFLFFQYVRYFGSLPYAFATIIASIATVATLMFGNLWLAIWTEATQEHKGEEDFNTAFYLAVYIAIGFFEIFIGCVSGLMVELGGWFAARRMHEECIRSVMGVSLDWFQQTPVGRIVNRFSSDMGSMDGSLANLSFIVLYGFVGLVFRLAAISSAMPLFVIPAAVTCGMGFFIGEMYTRTGVVIRRLASSAQSPFYSQFADTLSGLAVIRGRKDHPSKFIAMLGDRLRIWSTVSEAQYNINRWICVRMDALTAFVSLGAGIIAIQQVGTVSAGLVGFSLLNALALSNTILNLVRCMNEVEIEMQSFYRLKEYSNLQPEDKDDKTFPEEGEYTDDPLKVIPLSWPNKGEIEFRNVTIRYDLDGPDILKNINLKIRSGERVAIVGRTGSGKSTFVLSMLRFTNIISGSILYDGIDITMIPRKRLRQSLTIIPQEAVLFNGTVESNLDPTGLVPRPVLQQALHHCKGIASFDTVVDQDDDVNNAQDNGQAVAADGDEGSSSDSTAVEDDSAKSASRLSLDAVVNPKGENFSHGQRQVLSLSRALIRKSKLLLLDEATASMDYNTDQRIQEILRAELDESPGSRTLITIAHRLRTIADYDTVVVMGHGEVIETGPPSALYLAKGLFYEMVQSSGETEELCKIFESKSE